ncbi:DUF4124 domain-containing protein [Marinicella sp. W31]|uniref:DUF4124 domain-containing protein n=1 Tax=Marinicella sp. W31 TaxID=3023713 RepID=UPI00375730DC
MTIRFATVVLLICISPMALSVIYKCKTPEGSIKYSDRPCADEAQQTVIKEKITYTAALNQLIQKQILLRDMPNSDQAKEDMKSLVEAHALKIFTRLETFDKTIPFCESTLKADGKDLNAALSAYKKKNKLNILVGKRVLKQGYENAEAGLNYSSEKLTMELEQEQKQLLQQYTSAQQDGYEALLEICQQLHDSIHGETLMDL